MLAATEASMATVAIEIQPDLPGAIDFVRGLVPYLAAVSTSESHNPKLGRQVSFVKPLFS